MVNYTFLSTPADIGRSQVRERENGIKSIYPKAQKYTQTHIASRDYLAKFTSQMKLKSTDT